MLKSAALVECFLILRLDVLNALLKTLASALKLLVLLE
jgi:hypothetical protein